MLFYFNSKTEVTKLFKITGRIYEEQTHLPYTPDCHNELPEARSEDLMGCRGITPREVDRKSPKLEKFHETVSWESARKLYSTQKPTILKEISTYWNSINQ